MKKSHIGWHEFTVIPVLILLLAGLATACSGEETPIVEPDENAPAATMPAEPTAPPSGAADTEDIWSQVQKSGVLVVGTSSGYPPFEYIDGQTFELGGFDIALIKDVAARLGLQVEIRDMAFAGLENALQLREINAAAAAISVTEERLTRFDFSNVYYVGADGVLTKQGSQVVINSIDDMAAYRVGVQTGSVYGTWLQESLVNSGRMPSENLLRFDTTNEMLQALTSEQPLVDLLVMDLKPAESAATASGLQVIAQGLNQQLYAIAVPKGEDVFLTNLNDALLQMQLDGTIAALAKQYLGLDETQLQPTPTPGPAPVITPLPPVGCLNSMVFVADLTYPDTIPYEWPVVQAGEAIQKGWQIQNTGTCTWDENYALIYSGSQPAGVLQGDPVYIQGTVAPGGMYDIYVDVQTPDEGARYVGYYIMQAPEGALFGDRIWVAVEVTSDSVITESPTPEAPTPTLELVASPTAPQSPPTVTVVPSASGWPPQTNAAEIRPAEMRAELTILSNLLGYQVIDINGSPLGVATDYVINTCETYIIHISMDPDEAVSDQAGMRMMLPFEMVTINSGVLDAETNSIGMYLPFEPFPPAPIVPDTMNLTPTDWEPGVMEYWNHFVRLGVLTTECVVTDPVSGNPMPVYKTAYASELLGAALRDGIGNDLGTVLEAVLEPESGKLHFYVIELIDNQGLTLVPLGATNIPKEVLDSGAEISLELLTENEILLNAPRFDSLEEATSGGAIKAAFEYW